MTEFLLPQSDELPYPVDIDPRFILANHIEAALWATLGVGFLLSTISSKRRGVKLAAGIVLLAFGTSDWVESRTGAWYRPWWLLVWKGACLAVLLPLAVREVVLTRRARAGRPPAADR